MKNLFLLLLLPFFSCSTVNKLFHKEKHQSDSTAVIHERKDSVASKDSTVLRKKIEESGSETVINWGDTSIYIPFKDSTKDGGIYIYPKNPDDYFRFDVEKRTIISNKVPKSIVIKENSKITQDDALLVHSQISNSEIKDDSTHVKTKDKEVVKEVHKKRTFLWWLLLLIPAYIIYRNWPKIRAFAIHLITGL